jgi:hypothetical protein
MAEQASATMGGSSTNRMKLRDFMNFFIEKAQRCIVNAECSKNNDSALVVHGKKWQGRGKRGMKFKSGMKCDNCGGSEHTQPNCWSKGGGKEGQGLRQKKSKKEDKKTDESAAMAKTQDEELFVFTCTSVIIAQIKQNSKITEVLMTVLQLLMDALSKQLA